jgi:hypothetical protein
MNRPLMAATVASRMGGPVITSAGALIRKRLFVEAATEILAAAVDDEKQALMSTNNTTRSGRQCQFRQALVTKRSLVRPAEFDDGT